MYSREELADIFRGEGIQAHLKEGWIDTDEIEDPALRSIVQRGYDLLDLFDATVLAADGVFEDYYQRTAE